jgi:hypothetical protein|nr:MAG TPA: hypothetical protein [Caudoviricetes sp.]
MAEEITGVGAEMGAAGDAGQQSGQEAAAQAQAQQQPANVPDAQGQQEETFDSLIQGRYKKDFDAAMQKAVRQRVKTMNQYKSQADAMAPIIDQLGVLYGIDTSDPRKTDFEALAKRFSSDERLYSAEAMEKGVSADTLRSEYASRAENTAMRRQLQEYQMREAFAGIQDSFNREVAAVYGADFESEMQNGDFARLIAANVPPKTAYEVVHQAEIAQARAQAAAQQARENMVRTIQAQGARPEEIGSGAGGGTTVPMKTKWTRAEVEDMRRRAAMGERVIP